MESYEKVESLVRSKISEKRFSHSIRVVSRALEYGRKYGLDDDIVRLVAISHDIAKELTSEEIKYYLDYYNIHLDDVEGINDNLVHSKIGAEMVHDLFGFDLQMCDAVRYHTTGRANMSILEKVIFLADATEEGKSVYPKEYVDVIMEDIDKGMLLVCKKTLEMLLDKEKIIHENTIKCYNFYLK